MSNPKDLSKSELVSRVQRMRSTIQNVRKESEQIGERVVHSSLSLGGGILTGVMRGYNEDGEPLMVPGTEVPADAALAAGLLAIGVTGLAGKSSDYVTALGSGIGGAAAAFHVRDMVHKMRTE